jgi:hypothetical protein
VICRRDCRDVFQYMEEQLWRINVTTLRYQATLWLPDVRYRASLNFCSTPLYLLCSFTVITTLAVNVPLAPSSATPNEKGKRFIMGVTLRYPPFWESHQSGM